MNNIAYNTHLHAAIIQQDFDWAQMAIQFGADVNCVDEEGNTPLHLLVLHGNNQEDERHFVTLILKEGASLDIKNKNNLTAVDLAQDNEKWELAIEMASFHITKEK